MSTWPLAARSRRRPSPDLGLGREAGLPALSTGAPPADLGRVHFGFLVDDAEQVRAAHKRFGGGGVCETEWQDDSVTRVQVLDPDGCRVEIYFL